MNKTVIWGGLKVSFLIIGTVIGAGYASGREIWEFFSSYGDGSNLFILMAMLLFSVCCYIIMSISHRLKALHYGQVLEELLGKSVAKVYDLLIFFYLLSVTVVMFAGSGATLAYWSLSYWLGVALIGICVMLVFLRDVEGMMMLNSVLTPILIATLLSVCILFLWAGYGQESTIPVNNQVFSSALVFTALNILPLVAVLSALGSKMKQAEIKVASIASAVGLCSISLVYNQSLLAIGQDILIYEVPLFAILGHFSAGFMVVVSIVLWLAIFTTAVSNVFGLISRSKEKIPFPTWIMAALFILMVIPMTRFGFGNLVKVLYPLYGVLNLFLLGSILLYPLSNSKKIR